MSENQIIKRVEQEAAALSQVLGIPQDEIMIRRPDWLKFMRQGVLITPHVRRWRATMSLTPEHLGLTFADDEERAAFEKTLKLGNILLLPKRYIDRFVTLESRIRKAPEKYGFRTYWGMMLTPGDFIDWRAEHDGLVFEYITLAAEIRDNFQAIKSEVLYDHAANAYAAFRREEEHVIRGGASMIIDQYGMGNVGQFVEDYVERIKREIPDEPEAIYNTFEVTADFDYIPLPSAMAEDQAQVEMAFEKVERERQITQAEMEMRRAIAENTKKRVDDMVVSHLASIVEQLNQILLDAATDIANTVRANDKVHPRSVVQLKNAIAKVKSMADAMSPYLDYQDINILLERASQILDAPVDGKRDKAQVLEALQNIATVTKQTLFTLGQTPRAGRGKVEVVRPTDTDVRRARRALGLQETPQVPTAPTARRSRRG